MSPRAVDPAVLTIVGQAGACAGLDGLARAIRSCTACPELAATRQHVVVGDTLADARLLIVGEAPGATEDAEGRPFRGRGGQLLDRLLADAGLRRSDISVLNVLKCRPPQNRTPARAETARCTGWLDRQVALLDPPLVLTLGRTALTWAVNAKTRLADVRGTVHDWRGRRLIASYHPSAALRFGPNGEPHAALVADLRLAAEALR
ncbi:MAG TPA: uracil-DNA glycosylase [Mycobacteriales bacterium]|jgi:DNA polymerase|nr:uracil-DNA glycosylase [Mycobacteriales bacterium]